MDKPNIKEVVKEKYREAALRVNTGGSTCCGATSATSCGPDPITSNLYDAGQSGDIPAEALLASLGCGNPTALAKLAAGEVVLDLGSGGGIDVLLSAKRVGPTGKAYGLDMTDDIITRGEIAPEIRESVLLWVGCIAGALDENDYRNNLTAAGFDQVDIEATRIYRVEDAREFLSGQGLDVDTLAPQLDRKFLSAFIGGSKPVSKSCCSPACCN